MKKFLIILIFLAIAFAGSSQEDSTVNVPARAVRNALITKDSLEIMKHERESLLAIKSFYEKMQIKDSVIINKYDSLVTSKNREIRIYEKEVDNLTKQTITFQLLTTQLNGIIKQKNRTIVKITVAGVAIIGFLSYLLIKN